jgi:hypothetical protein
MKLFSNKTEVESQDPKPLLTQCSCSPLNLTCQDMSLCLLHVLFSTWNLRSMCLLTMTLSLMLAHPISGFPFFDLSSGCGLGEHCLLGFASHILFLWQLYFCNAMIHFWSIFPTRLHEIMYVKHVDNLIKLSIVHIAFTC